MAKSTTDDYEYISTRFTSNLTPDQLEPFTNVTQLCATNNLVDSCNEAALKALGKPVVEVKACKSRPPDQRDLSAAQILANQAPPGRHMYLQFSEGAPVTLRTDLWVTRGLFNGALGTIMRIIPPPRYENGRPRSTLQTVFLVDIPTYRGPSFVPGEPTWVPIVPCDHQDTNSERYFHQVPLELAWARTIHKAQGSTLEKARINIGDRSVAGLRT